MAVCVVALVETRSMLSAVVDATMSLYQNEPEDRSCECEFSSWCHAMHTAAECLEMKGRISYGKMTVCCSARCLQSRMLGVTARVSDGSQLEVYMCSAMLRSPVPAVVCLEL